MRATIIFALAATSAVRAQFQYLLPQERDELSPRDFGDGICVLGSTCEECFGEGYIICDRIGCFNPDKNQQCCKDAVLCVAKTNSCCKDFNGAGKTGSAGAPASNTLPTPDPSAANTWQCTRSDTGEECCHRGGPDMHWCSGDFPDSRCFNATNQWCCTDGTVCDEATCCKDLFGLDTTHPWKTASATPTPTSGSESSKGAASDTSAVTETVSDATPTEDAEDVAPLGSLKMELVGIAALLSGIALLL